jgi:trigger factor
VPSTVEQLSPTRVKITIEVPFDDLKPSMDKAYREVAKSVNIPGFRKGKVPPMVIDQRFGRGAIIQEALNDALPRIYTAAVAENHLAPLAQPEVEVTKLEDGERVEFVAEVDVRPDFELPDFSEIEVTVDPVEVPDSLVDEQIEALRNRFGSRSVVERPAQAGDLVTIDLAASRDGEPLPDATAEGLDYEVGSGGMLDGLDEAVTGLSAGESAQFSSTLVGGPMKGEPADIEVTVTKVQEQELPEVDDEFAQLASEFDTVAELRADVSGRLANVARLDQAGRARDAVLENLLGRLDLEVPEHLVASDVEARKQQIRTQLDAAGLTLEQYLADSEEGSDPDEFWADVEKRSGDALKAQMILDKIAEERQLSVDQNDLTQHILRKAQQEQTSPQQVAEHLQEHPHHIDEYMTEIRRGKALAVLVEAARVTDTTGAPVQLTNLQPDGSLAPAADDQPAEGEPSTPTDAAETAESDVAEPADAEPAEAATAEDARA